MRTRFLDNDATDLTRSSFAPRPGEGARLSRGGYGRATFCVLILLAGVATEPMAAEPAAGAAEPDAALVDAIVRKLESSGALDAAVDRAVARQALRQRQALQEEEGRVQAQQQALAKKARAVDANHDHIYGKAVAEVSLIFHGTPKALLDRYGGQVNWVIRNFPLQFHDPAARKEALAAECVSQLGGNDAYWRYADALFVNTRSNGSGLPEDKSVEKLAETVGIKSAALTQCMNDNATAKRVEQDLADGNAAGVTGTPTTVVRNNKTRSSEAVVGALPADGIAPAIERILKAKP